MAKGYILAQVTVPDQKAYSESGYMGMAQAAIAAHGGRYLVRGGNPEPLEGEAVTERIVILEFPSRKAAERFYQSEHYAPAKVIRGNHSTARFTLLEEYDPA